ncbi:Y-family DNA polymerase [Paracandidimonas soli]|uniref:Y-family DNA polymerase n=1 Tax=Paracandidimonas soli TaxID=1917182 RepID=UPI0033409280
MRLWIGVHLSHASLDTQCPTWRTEPVVVLEHDKAKAVSPCAEAAGVKLGMRRSGVGALCPAAVLLPYDRHNEKRAMDEVSLALLQYTPEVALSDDNTLLLDVSASLSLFGGVRRLFRRVQATLEGIGFAARISVAPTAGGAWLLAARPCRLRRALRLSTLARRLDALPCCYLPAARPYCDWLDGIGCATVGSLRALPRAGLQRRTGKSVLHALDAAYGQAPEVFDWIVAPPEFSGRIELMERIEYAEALIFAVRRLIEQLCGWLAARSLAVVRVVFELGHERGRHARPATGIALALGTPTWHADHLLRLLAEHLHHLVLPAPVIEVRLHAADTEARRAAPADLFPDPGGSPEDEQRLIEVLMARLGRENVRRPSPVADHRPEIANRWVPVDEKPKMASCIQAAERPFWLLDEPVALPVKGHRPFYGVALHVVRGPERIEDGWWAGLALRDYYIAQSESGARYWLYQERGKDTGWFLHGLFA